MKFYSVVFLVLLTVACDWNNPSHKNAYISDLVKSESSYIAEPKHRLIFYGDAGHSTMLPWQKSLESIASRAAIYPEKTSVIALGDNIYHEGFPKRNAETGLYDEQAEREINALKAQLKIARTSMASLYIVPGNHDWYAGELITVDSFIRSEDQKGGGGELYFYPDPRLEKAVSVLIELDAVGLMFVDSQRLIIASEPEFNDFISTLSRQVAIFKQADPDRLLIISAHHPIQAVGKHAGYYTRFRDWLVAQLVVLIKPGSDNQGAAHPDYQRYIAGIRSVIAAHTNIILAAGHDHSLQVFAEDIARRQFSLVSGAANEQILSGVWHNENTMYAHDIEGFLEVDVLDDGVFLRAFASQDNYQKPITSFWLWRFGY